jgi:hypothetical protein
MKSRALAFGGIAVDVPVGWSDITEQVEGTERPFTLAMTTGENSGALQFSPALYRSGPLPSASAATLLKMVRQFGATKNLGEVADEATHEGTVSLAAASFHLQTSFVRVWYVSDGRNIALVTYVTDWGNQKQHLADCEAIVRSIRFE